MQPRLVSLERLLEGLEVEIEPPPCASGDRNGIGYLELVGGTVVRLSPPSATSALRRRASRRARRAAVRIRVTYQRAVGLFEHLPQPLTERVGADDPIRGAFRELVDELARRRPGYRAMTELLGRRCLILLLRRAFEHDVSPPVWMASLGDDRLGRAVAAMRARPEHAFTLPELAELAGMSRSAFAARFAGALAQSPIGFLKTVRLARAVELLTRTDMPVKAVAARVGYSSRSSFTRAFLARHGAAPATFRVATRHARRHPSRVESNDAA
jgi:AraC-like DNA-binding protein